MPSPEEVAAWWVPGVGPLHVEPLVSGLVNASYRVLRAGRWYSLRLAAAEDLCLGVDREWECRVLAAAAAAGVAPHVNHCDPTQGILVGEWVSGKALSDAEIGEAAVIESMAALLRKVHALQVPGPARCMTPAAWLDTYAAVAQRTGARTPRASSLLAAAHLRLECCQERSTAAVLCHGDVHRFNVVRGSGLLLLDWEYAHMADPLWDLAGWAANNDWSGQLAARLLQAYQQETPTRADLEHLGVLSWLYDYVCLLWSELYLNQRCGQAEEVDSRANLLTARLARVR